MKHIFEEIQKKVNLKAAEQAYQRDEEGRVIINMSVKDDSGFLSTYSEGDAPIINSEVSDFIEHCTDAVRPNERLTLRIRSSCIDENEQVLYRQAIGEYYLQKYIANEREYKRNKILVALLMLFGVLVLAFQVFFDYTVGSSIWSEVIDIFAWVLVWEAVDIGVFESRSLKLKKQRYLSYMDMKILYASKEDEKSAQKEAV